MVKLKRGAAVEPAVPAEPAKHAESPEKADPPPPARAFGKGGSMSDLSTQQAKVEHDAALHNPALALAGHSAAHIDDSVAHDHGHGHGGHDHKPPGKLGQVAGGVVLFILYFFFCVVFSAVIFGDLTSTTSFGVSDGVGIVLLGIGVGCIWFAMPMRPGSFWGSSCKAIVSGPDLIPIITVQESGAAIQEYIGISGGSVDASVQVAAVGCPGLPDSCRSHTRSGYALGRA